MEGAQCFNNRKGKLGSHFWMLFSGSYERNVRELLKDTANTSNEKHGVYPITLSFHMVHVSQKNTSPL